VFVLALLAALPLNAQNKDDNINIRPGLKEGFQMPKADEKAPAEGKSFPVAATVVAVAGSLLILAIICTPSRRA
jgi:hypothetical protein